MGMLETRVDLEPIYHVTVNNGLVLCDRMDECVYPAEYHVCKLDPGETLHMVLLHSKQHAFSGFNKDVDCNILPKFDSEYDDLFTIWTKLYSYVQNYKKLTGDLPSRYEGVVWSMPAFYSLRNINLEVTRQIEPVKISYATLKVVSKYCISYNGEKVCEITGLDGNSIDYRNVYDNIRSLVWEDLYKVLRKTWKTNTSTITNNEVRFITQSIMCRIIQVEKLLYPRPELNSLVDRIVGFDSYISFVNLDDGLCLGIIKNLVDRKQYPITVSNSVMSTTYLVDNSVDLDEEPFSIVFDKKRIIVSNSDQSIVLKKKWWGRKPVLPECLRNTRYNSVILAMIDCL